MFVWRLTAKGLCENLLCIQNLKKVNIMSYNNSVHIHVNTLTFNVPHDSNRISINISLIENPVFNCELMK